MAFKPEPVVVPIFSGIARIAELRKKKIPNAARRRRPISVPVPDCMTWIKAPRGDHRSNEPINQ
jgi:hypothetical protein